MIVSKLDDVLFTLKWPLPIAVIVFFMALFSFVAFKRNHLSVSGSLAAFVSGVVILYCMRFEGFFIFFWFYASSNVIGKVSRKRRKADAEKNFEKKGSRRDWVQVFANGFMAVLCSLLYFNTGSVTAVLMFCASVAEAASDTWAGEIGRLSKSVPVSIRTFRQVPRGMSGGITALGIAGGFVASLVIAFFFVIFFPVKRAFLYAVPVLVSGFAGCLADSWLGATCQALYVNSKGELTERENDDDGTENRLIRGIRWLNNDIVNLVSNVFACVLSAGLSVVIGRC